MSLLKLLVTVLIVAIPQIGATAEPNASAKHLIISGDNTNPEFTKSVNAAVSAMIATDQYLGELKRPDHFRLSLNSSMLPSYSISYDELTAPLGYIQLISSQTPLILSQSQIRPILIHEYAHIVVARNMGSVLPGWDAYKAQVARLKSAGEEIDALRRLIKQLDRGQELDATNSRMDEQKRILSDAALHLQAMPHWDSLIAPYNEFFADLVAILVVGSAQAISGVISTLDPSLAPLHARDFSYPHQAVGFSKTADHEVLDPSRSHIWNKIIKVGLSSKSKQKYISCSLVAIADEVGNLAKNANDPSPETRNLSFIKALDNACDN